jgi:hypothetical protein
MKSCGGEWGREHGAHAFFGSGVDSTGACECYLYVARIAHQGVQEVARPSDRAPTG